MIWFCERKVKNDFGAAILHFSLICASYLVIVTWHFHIRKFFHFWSLSRDFWINGTSLLLGRVVQRTIVSCFSDSIVEKTTQQLDGICNVTSDSQFLYKLFKNSLFVSANTFEKYILSEDYCIARQYDNMCFLANCWYHIKLRGDKRELTQKLDAFCFIYQYVDCLFNFSGTNSVAKLLSRVDDFLIMCRGQFISTAKREELTECPAWRKKNLEEKVQKNLLSPIQKNKSIQSDGSVFAGRLQQVRKTKFKLELLKIV